MAQQMDKNSPGSAPLRSAPPSCAHAAVLGRIRGIVRVAPDLYYSVKHTQQGRTRIALEAVPTAWYTAAKPCCTGRCTQQGRATKGGCMLIAVA